MLFDDYVCISVIVFLSHVLPALCLCYYLRLLCVPYVILILQFYERIK